MKTFFLFVDVLAASTSVEAKQEADEDKEGRPSNFFTCIDKTVDIEHLSTCILNLILFGYQKG